MPTLPLIDLMILVAWTSLLVAGVQKAIGLALHVRPVFLGMAPFDFVVLAGVCLLFALALAARVWVRANEGALLRGRRAPLLGGSPAEVMPDFPDPRAAPYAGAREADLGPQGSGPLAAARRAR